MEFVNAPFKINPGNEAQSAETFLSYKDIKLILKMLPTGYTLV